MGKEIKCSTCGYKGEDEHDDLYDCVEQWEEDNGIRKGQWMVDWMKRLKEKETNLCIGLRKMVKETLSLLVTSLTLITSLISCEEIQVRQSVSSEDEIEIVFFVEPRLDQDENGYYHLELNPSKFQTLHRLSGHIYLNGEPLEVMKFNLESSHHWMLGDTLGYFIHRGLTDDLEYLSYDTTYITGFVVNPSPM